MKFTVNRELFIDKLEKANAVVNPKASIPVLSGVLMDCSQQGFVLTGSDATETVINVTRFGGENGECEEGGKAVIPAASIIKVLKKFKKNTIMVELDGDALTLKESEKKFFTFMTMAYEEFPQFEVNEGVLWTTLERTDFELIGKQSLHCTSTIETRPILQGIHFNLEENQLKCTATDSFRLGKTTLNVGETTCDSIPENGVVLSATSFKNALKIMNKEKTVELRVINNTQVMIKGKSVIYQSRLLEGNYPDTTRLIPTSFASTVKISKTELLDTLEQISFISNAAVIETTDSIFLKITPEGNDLAKASLELGCEFEGDIQIKVNVKYLIDCIRTIDEEDIQINFCEKNRPFTLHGVNDTNGQNLQLVLPIRL